MTDNNGRALREAKAYLALPVTIGTDQVAHKRLAALVDEIERAPVGHAVAMVDQESEWLDIGGITFSAELSTINGQRVRVLAVGEQP